MEQQPEFKFILDIIYGERIGLKSIKKEEDNRLLKEFKFMLDIKYGEKNGIFYIYIREIKLLREFKYIGDIKNGKLTGKLNGEEKDIWQLLY